jgi:hypothetical protein
MKKIDCEKNKDTFIASNKTLFLILATLLSRPEIEVFDVHKCNRGGWHIFAKNKNYETYKIVGK